MKPFTWMRYAVARWAFKAANIAIVPPWVRESILTPAFHSLTREGYQKNAAFLACISTLNFGISEAPLMVYQDERPLPNHPTRKLLRRPNPIMSGSELKVMAMTYMGIGGNAYLHKVRNSAGRVIQLWPYHAGQFSPVPGGPSWVQGYTYDDGSGTLTPVEAADVIHIQWPTPDPTQPWMAMPPLRAAAVEVDADNEASRYLSTLLQNDAVPRTIIHESDQRFMNDDEVRRAKEQFEDRYGGNKRGGALILEAGAKISRLSLNLEELAFEAMHNIPEARIAAVMRVPPIVAGLNVGLNRSTFANYGEARQAFTRDTLVPLWNIIADALDADPDLNSDGLTIKHDLSNVASLQEDQNGRWARVISGYTAGLMEDATAQDLLGLPRYQAPTPVPPPAPAQPKAFNPEAKSTRGIGRSLQRIRHTTARSMEHALDSYFTDLGNRVIARAQKAWLPAQEQKALPLVEDLLTDSDLRVLSQLVGDWYIEIVRLSWETWNLALGAEIVFGLENPAVVEALAIAGTNITSIHETTLAAVQAVLRYGAEQGWTIDDLVRGDDSQAGLQTIVTETYKNRARAIARTELGTAQNVASISRYEQSGVAQVRVLDGNGPNSCQACTDLNNSLQSLAWARVNPLGHPNCIRAFAPVIED